MNEWSFTASQSRHLYLLDGEDLKACARSLEEYTGLVRLDDRLLSRQELYTAGFIRGLKYAMDKLGTTDHCIPGNAV